MISDELEIVDGNVAGAWISPRLEGAFGAVTLQIPTGFEAYARVFHPASDSDGNPVKWKEVADACGTTPHREMQWHAILGLSSAAELRGAYSLHDETAARWSGSDPPVGSMGIETLDALCSILTTHTTGISRCFFGLSTISGWLDSLPSEKVGPLLELPHDRSYIILTGPLYAVHQIRRDWSSAGSLELRLRAEGGNEQNAAMDTQPYSAREAPNLIWPADQSWFVASEVDFDSTLVGGSTELIHAIIDSPNLEAWHVEATDSLADDADTVNQGKRPGSPLDT
jgi:hypothetical protein